jgi:hypothetical protein
MGARFGFAGGEGAVAFDRGMTDMQVAEREKEIKTTTPSSDATGAYQPSKFDTLIYPSDLEPENFYPECIKFTVMKRVGLDLKKTVDYVVDNIVPNYESAEAIRKKAVSDRLDNRKRLELESIHGKGFSTEGRPMPTETVLESASALLNDGFGGKISSGVTAAGQTLGGAFNEGKASLAEQSKLRAQGCSINTLGSMYLNMPNNIQFTENANWNGEAMGWVGAIKDVGFSGTVGQGAVGSIGNLVSGTAGGAIGTILGKFGVSGSNLMLGSLVTALSQGDKIQHGFDSLVSMKSNPYMEMLFQGVDFRRFTFTFMLRPRSEDEVKQVAGIIKMFRLHSRPSWNSGLLNGGHGYMKYPQEFHISFLTLEKGQFKFAPDGSSSEHRYIQNTGIPQIKPCVCTGVETNYTPQSIWAAFRQGKPIATSLAVSFTETELVMAEDIVSNY